MRITLVIPLVGLQIVGGSLLLSQTQAPIYSTRTEAVLLDVVVRDKRGEPMTDLVAEEFIVLENGAKQHIISVTSVARSSPPTRRSGSDEASKLVDELDRAPSLNALVFDRLTPESRVLAVSAAKSLLASHRGGGDYVGVFLIDLSLLKVQDFTNDAQRLTSALDVIAARATTFQNLARVGTGVGATPVTAPAEARVGSTSGGRAMQDNVFGDIEGSLEEGFRGLENLQQGHAALNALTRLVDAMGVVPGRKSLIYIADGLPLAAKAPGGGEGLRARFGHLIQAANRAGVSIYPVDAVGLRVHSQELATGQALQQASKAALDSESGGGIGFTEQLTAGTTSQVFQRLARETGGFAIENTNDLSSGLRRIANDQRFHYQVAYLSTNSQPLGDGRRTDVRVTRKGAVVKSRSAYAVGMAPTVAVGETLALTRHRADPLKNDLPIELQVFRHPTGAQPGELVIAVRLDRSTVQAAVRSIYLTTRVLDNQGNLVRRGSAAVPLDDQSTPVGDLLWVRQPVLPPGRYVVEAVAYDPTTDLLGAARVTATVEAEQDAVGGDLIVLDRLEPLDAVAPSAREGGLSLGTTWIAPRVGKPLVASQPVTIPIYCTLRSPTDGGVMQGTARIVIGDRVVLKSSIIAGPPATDGYVRQIIRLPTPGLPAGHYTLIVEWSDGTRAFSRRSSLTVQ